VKLIGDGAMIAAPSAEPVAMATEDLVATVSGDARFRGAHGGIASGRVFARNGDYLGAPVNLASRLSEVARSGEILCDAMTAVALPERTKPAGERMLRGFDGPQPVYALIN
jgi:adenylate cyclase